MLARVSSGINPTTRYVVNRIFAAIGTFLFVIVFNFFLFRLLPGDPIALYTKGRNVDPEEMRHLRASFNACSTPCLSSGSA